MTAHQQGQLAEAQARYEDILRLQPRHAEALHLLGIVAGQTGHPDRAVELIDAAIAADPRNAGYHSNRGVALQSLGRLETAIESFDAALALEPGRAADHFNRALSLQQLDRLEPAIDAYDTAVTLRPEYPEAFANRGIALEALGRFDDALASYDRAIALVPDYADAHSNRGIVLQRLGQLDAAVTSFDVAIVLRPDYAEAHSNRGVALQEQGRLDEAVASFDRAIALRPDDAEAYSNRGTALEELGRLDEAVASFDRALALRPDYAEAHSNRGIVLRKMGRLEEALASYDKAIALKPDYAEAWSNRGNALIAIGRADSALASFDRAITLRPDYAEAYSNRGIALAALHQPDVALASYERAIAFKPDYAEAYSNRGIALQELGRLDAAVESYEQAIALKPDYADAHANRGVALSDLKRFKDALQSYSAALALRPDYAFLPGAALHVRMQICDWTNFDTQSQALEREIASGHKASASFPVLSIFDSPLLHRLSAETWAAEKCPPNPALGPVPRVSVPREKIRVGYFSADFGAHPLSYLMAGVFEEHDRSRFEITGFSFGAGEPDAMTARVAAAMDTFIDVRRQSDLDVARLARSRGIDIAIDLGGYTHSSRPGIFAARAAPIQASYLGYLGTLGAPWMDYLLADDVIVPSEMREQYTEKIAYLASYQANDRKRAISDRPMTRAEFGLPDDGFVFCSFNATYKILPATFASWMRILRQVNGSVLFLLGDNAQAVDNLRREAARLGVAPERLVIARRLPPDEYIARYRVADLFLDTVPYNAGTTASDALWAGLPVLTLRGEAFPARVAASLLTAIGLPELITTSANDYERVAVELASDSAQLNALRQKLLANRLTTPLFDTVGFTRDLESMFARMVARSDAKLAADHLPRQS